MDLGSFAWQGTQLNNAVEAGLLYSASSVPSPNLLDNGWNTTNSSTNISNSAQLAGTANVSMSAPACLFGCPSTTGIAVIDQGGNPSCASTTAHTCTSAGVTTAAGEYVQIGGTLSRTSLFSSGLVLPSTLNATVIVRVQ
jgi:hypothetical protein